MSRLWWTGLLLAAALCSSRPPGAEAHAARAFTMRVVEVAQTVDLARGGRHWLTLTVEVGAGQTADTALLRHVQPLREHFILRYEGVTVSGCEWLKGGSSPEDPALLRFQAGFPMPPPGVRAVSLTMLLPEPRQPESPEFIFKASDLARQPATVTTPDGVITISAISVQAYTPPSLPVGGRFSIKGDPRDARIFQRPLRQGEKQPERALLLTWRSPSADLFDRAVDIDGSVVGVDGKRYPLLSARLERFPSRALKGSSESPRVEAQYWFIIPPKGVANGALLKFVLRAHDKQHSPVRSDELPIPGR